MPTDGRPSTPYGTASARWQSCGPTSRRWSAGIVNTATNWDESSMKPHEHAKHWPWRETPFAREAALAQRRLDLAHSDKAALAAGLLSPFEFVTCPRCLQSVTGRETDDGHCLLCQQPEPRAPHESDDEERARLRAQLAETEALLADEQEAMKRAEGLASVAELNAAEAQRRYDQLTRDAVSPRVQAVAEASTKVESLRQQLRNIDQRTATWRKLGESEKAVADLNGRRRRLDAEIKRLAKISEDRQERLDRISELFAAEVARVGVNVNGKPTISADKYLPKIGGSDLDTLQASGGGSTTAINVAFSLALLNYAIGDGNVLLPSLLIIDTPRKAIGQSGSDKALAERIYDRLRAFAQALSGIGQLIIADNDAELGAEKNVSLIRLTQEDSAVPGVPNTGVGTKLKVEDIDVPEGE